jgi:hypothetical protein
LLFTKAEVEAFSHLAEEAGFTFETGALKTVEI